MRLKKATFTFSVLLLASLLAIFQALVPLLLPKSVSAQSLTNASIEWLAEEALRVNSIEVSLSVDGVNADAASIQGDYVYEGEHGPVNIGTDVDLVGGFRDAGLELDDFRRYEHNDGNGCKSYIIAQSNSRLVAVFNPYFGGSVNGCAWDKIDANVINSVLIITIDNSSDPDSITNTDNAPANFTEEEGTSAPPSCDSENSIFSLGWMLCGLLNFFDSTVTSLGNAADSLLAIPSEYYSNDGLYATWSYFRAIATVLLLAVGLIMVIGQALGGGS